MKDSGEYPCSVCRKGVGSNSIYCAGCSHWVHKKCSGVTGSLKSNPDYRCSRCKGTARPIDGRPHNEWLLMQDKKLGINNIQTLLRYNRLRWFGHVVRNDGCINSITEFEVVGQRGRGRPKKTWKDTINNDLRRWKLSRADPANRMEWRKKLRTNIGAVRPTLSGTDMLNE